MMLRMLRPAMFRAAALVLGCVLYVGAARAAADTGLPLVPLPRQITRLPVSYRLPSTLTIDAPDVQSRGVASFLAAYLGSLGIATTIANTSGSSAAIRLDGPINDVTLGSEGYRLTVDDAGIVIEANGGAGLFYGVQTLEQLANARAANGRPVVIPGVRIVDWPQYRWRGIHLDVSRHFFPVPVVKQYIDLASRYKLNVFHWHLTDDQGWRIEIKKHPRLTQVGACRDGTQVGGEGSTITDGRRYCGFYTQAQIRDVVAYASARYVNILPEIEGPGHSVAAVAAYPWLGCDGKQYAVRQLWGVSTQIMCPTERTFKFLDDVLGEVAALFPWEYVHVGGDEVPKDAWIASPIVWKLRVREHLKTYDSVQGYFTRRVEEIALRHHRRIVGWDEILAGGVSRQATVMSWQGTSGGIAAAERGNDVVMTPDGLVYLDAYQGNGDYEPLAIGGLTPLETVYEYDPMPAGLPSDRASHILGAQANLWAEYVPTSEHLFYMLLPRELALSELCWTPRSMMNFNDFSVRIAPELRRLEAEGYHYRIPDVTFGLDASGVEFPEQQTTENAVTVTATGDAATLTLRDIARDATVRYTLDGSIPTAASSVASGPIRVPLTGSQAVTIAAIAVLPDGRSSAPAFLTMMHRP